MFSLIACHDCGTEFAAKRSDALYCLACRRERRRQIDHRAYTRDRVDACPNCGATKYARAGVCSACWAKRLQRQAGEDNPNWKGGRSASGGYLQVRRPRGKAAYTYEHIAVWEDANGPVPPNHHIHHLNGNKHDNRIENLVALPHTEHPHWNRQPYEARIHVLEERLRAAGLPID